MPENPRTSPEKPDVSTQADQVAQDEQAPSLLLNEQDFQNLLERVRKDHPKATLEDLPKDEEGLIFLMSENPAYFHPEHIEHAAINDSERSDKLIAYLAETKEYDRVFRVLQGYMGTPRFEYLVQEIETRVPGDVLIAFANRLSETITKISEVSEEMKKTKQTARTLATYDKFFNTSQNDHQELSGKKLLLVGGGNSPIKENLTGGGVDVHVTNIDPLADPNDHANADEPIRGDFFHTPIESGQYQEIWASHSLPMYAFDRDQVRDFYRKSLEGLVSGGVLRIMPIDRFSDALTPAMRLTRKPVNIASLQCVEVLRRRPDLFEIEDTEIEHKSGMGKKTTKRGVNIRTIGNIDEVRAYVMQELASESQVRGE